MKQKTISGHYDSVYSLDHNNRRFIPKNVDLSRIENNYNCIAAGEQAFPAGDYPVNTAEMWRQYRWVCNTYWEQREVYKASGMDQTREGLWELRRLYYSMLQLPHDPLAMLIKLLFLPVLIPCGIAVSALAKEAAKELENERFQQWARDQEFKLYRKEMRAALREYDVRQGTQMCQAIDELIASMPIFDIEGIPLEPPRSEEVFAKDYTQARFATIEEIYAKCFEPSFRRFQDKQRPCRRYEGTYLEQIREKQDRSGRSKGSRSEKSRAVAEAIEIVYCIGDMDNTGYDHAPMDAKRSEILLKDFCDHLLQDPHVCYVTTRELDDLNWQPPFKHGLIVLNLIMHGDEATPGVHLTCIPYSCDCKRGPGVQASLGRAMTGMGYPSTWKDVLDQDGEPIPKKDRNGNVILNDDGTIRYQQEPDEQGIVDWIEGQKKWLAQEMQKRYGWEREYKGSHPRGNLSTPEYKVARALERLAEMEQAAQRKLQEYELCVQELTVTLERAVSVNWESMDEQDAILQYLNTCPDDQYEALLDTAMNFLKQLPAKEQAVAVQSLQALVDSAKARAGTQENKVLRTENRER